MKKKILSFLMMIMVLIPCAVLFSACGKIDSLKGKTFVFSKIEIEGELNKDNYEAMYKTISFEFDEEDVTYVDGANEDTYNYKFENNKIYLKADIDADFPTTPYAEFSNKNMIITETVEGGVVKVYFKIK